MSHAANNAPVTVRDNPASNRFEVYVGDALAGFSSYRLEGRDASFVHTEIDPAFEGRGLGSVLVGGALDEMARRAVGVLPLCPFVLRFIRRHPDYLRLVPAPQRKQFGLPAAVQG